MLKDNVERAKKMGVRFLRWGWDSTAEGITKVANDENVDFIIIGSTGLSNEDNQSNKLKFFICEGSFNKTPSNSSKSIDC